MSSPTISAVCREVVRFEENTGKAPSEIYLPEDVLIKVRREAGKLSPLGETYQQVTRNRLFDIPVFITFGSEIKIK